MKLFIDLETYSDIDITKCGSYKYSESPFFQILLFGYAFDGEGVQVINLMEYGLPTRVYQAMTDARITKIAHNANFERNCMSVYMNQKMNPDQWRCSQVKALTMGLPAGLAMIGKALKWADDKAKMKEGKALINYFCKPCKPTKANDGRTRNLPEHDPDKWATFIDYNAQDVEVERSLYNSMEQYPTTETEIKLWELDQRINDRGVYIDKPFIDQVIKCDAIFTARMKTEAEDLTGLSNPNSPAQLKKWVGDKIGRPVTCLNKDSVAQLLKESDNEDVKKILELRQLMAKTSIKKYHTMSAARCDDGRVRGLLQFYGANRTGRWAGRLVQVQNLPKNYLPDLDDARKLVSTGAFKTIEFLFDSVPDTLSQLVRTAFIAKSGSRFIVNDFSAIEARVIAWLAGETWRLKVFATHGKIYEASAAAMFRVPIEDVTKALRAKGKIAELALGYGGANGALEAMGALKMGLTEDELRPLVDKWREANKRITHFWWTCDRAARKAITEKTNVGIQYGIKFIYAPGVLFIKLPSGRKLAYPNPKIEPDEKFSGDKITYEGMEQTTKQWVKLDTYGPKIVENITQAIARDALAETMLRVDQQGFNIVMHVHDEIISEVPNGTGSVDEINNIFAQPIAWAPGLLLKSEGYETRYYKKD